MEKTDLKINDLLGKGNLLTFLIGSGCSIDAPSNVPEGNKIKEDLVKYFCAESEIENILKIEGLKLEFLLATIFDNLGDNVEIFDYFELFNKPNLQHFFLADCINKGHFLMTTNFDFLIETALLELGIPKREIFPIISEKEFISYSNPADLYKRGFKAIYKIHGSAKNIITGAEKQSSLINSIKELGFNRAGKSLFQIEPFKRTFLDSVCNGRSLVVMGYSGVNDSDIIPTIKSLTNFKKIIWINHSKSIQPGNETIYEIKHVKSLHSFSNNKNLTKLAEILYDIRRFSNISKIYLINANLVNIIKNLIQIKPKLRSGLMTLSMLDWLKKNIKSPNMFEKVLITSRIYYKFGFFNDAMKCSEIMTRFVTLADVKSWKSIANEALAKSYLYQHKKLETQKLKLNKDRVQSQINALTMRSKSLILVANIYFSVEKFPEAIKKFEEVLEIYEKLGYSKDIAKYLNRIGDIYYKYKNYNVAMKYYNRALKIYNQSGDLNGKVKSFISIGKSFLVQKNYPKARKSYLSALKLHRELNLLKGKAIILNHLGEIMRLQKNYSKATKYAMNAVKLNQELRDWKEKAISLKIIACINEDQKKYSKAIKFYKKAAELYEKLGNLSDTASCLKTISKVYKIQGNNSEALIQNECALKLYQQIDDSYGIGSCLFDIANTNFTIANYQKALKYYEDVSKLNEHSISLAQKSISLKNMGLIHHVQGNYSRALIMIEEAIEIDGKLENLNDQAIGFYRIAMIHFDQKNYSDALIYINKSIEIYEKLKDLKGLAVCLGSKGDLFRFQKYFSEALNQYKLSLRLREELGDSSMKAYCLINIGEVYKEQGKLSGALIAYNHALNINKQLGDSIGEAICLNSIGNIFRMQGDYPMALEHCQKALKINEEGEDLSVKAKCLRNIALIKQDQGNYSEALKYYKETLLIFKKYGLFEDSEIRDIEKKIKTIFLSFQRNYIPQTHDPNKVSIEKDKRMDPMDKRQIFSNIIYKIQGNYEKALKYYKGALKKAEKSDDLYEKLKNINAIGEIYQIQGLYLEAVKKFEEALEIARLIENESLKFKLVSKIRELYNKIFKIS